MILLLLLAACPPPDRAWTGPPRDTGGGAPTVAFTFPTPGTVLAEGDALSVQAQLDDDGPLDALQVSATEDGGAVQPTLSADGSLTWTTTVQPGTHEARIEVIDADGLRAEASVAWTGDALPTLTALAPDDGASLDADAAWTLRLRVQDADGEADTTWAVEVEVDGAPAASEVLAGPGPLDQELEWQLPPLGPGEHQVDARVDDEHGAAALRLTLYGA